MLFDWYKLVGPDQSLGPYIEKVKTLPEVLNVDLRPRLVHSRPLTKF
jgi:hypothetical protein